MRYVWEATFVIVAITILGLFVWGGKVMMEEQREERVKGELVYRLVVPEEDKKEMREWILQVVKNANPMSDEEPEDNIIQAERTAKNIFGKLTPGLLVEYSFIPYHDLSDGQKKRFEKLKEENENVGN